MGKSKQAQRTKNNARPSSSSRSAEKLGSATPNFVGFSAVKDGGYVPVLPGLSLSSSIEVEMNILDVNFQTVLKKMNKKDSTTKYKALQEFSTLCQTSELSLVESVLPFWPRFYCALSIDTEHRVREAAQIAHGVITKRVGRAIAMYLKQIAGPWFTSQFDTYPPAASAASNSFNETFPKGKVVDAVVHCQREILTYVSNNITVQTPQSLLSQKSLSAEEMEAIYQKIVISSLCSYSSYFKTVPIHEIQKVQDLHSKILSSTKFWKLAKHESLPIKTAFFGLLSSMVENAEPILQEQKKKVLTTIINSLDETEPGLLSAIWESMLVAVNKIEDWFNVVNIEKLVLPKLWRVLRSGGQSCASVIYPNLLPFVSQFPKLNVDINKLYTDFFDNMRQGFLVKSVQLSRSETNAVVMSFVECLRYTILANSSNIELCNKLLIEQLMPVIDMCITQNTPIKSVVFTEVAQLLRYWSKNRENEDYKSYSELIKNFWIELRKIFNKATNPVEQNVITTTLDIQNSQIDFLISLKKISSNNRKNLKVQFSDLDEPVTPICQINTEEINTDGTFLMELDQFVSSLCNMYFEQINVCDSKENLKFLCKFVKTFESTELFTTLANSCKENNLYEFYTKTVEKCLSRKSDGIRYIVQLTFCLIRYMEDADKDKLLESLIELDDIKIIRNVIYCCLSEENRNDKVIRKWVSQPNVFNLLIDVAKDIASGRDADKNLLLLAFEPSQNGDVLISEEGINEIANILCNSVKEVNAPGIIQITKVISSLVPIIWIHKEPTTGAVLLLETLLELCTRVYPKKLVSVDEMRKVLKNGLHQGCLKLPRIKFIELVKKCAGIIWQKAFNSDEMQIDNVLIDLAADLAEVITDNMKGACAQEIILTFLTELDIKRWLIDTTNIVVYAEIISGNVYTSSLCQMIQVCDDVVSIDLSANTSWSFDNIEQCLKWALFNTKFLCKLYLGLTEDTDDTDVGSEESNQQEKCQSFTLPGVGNVLANILFATSLGYIHNSHYKSTRCSSNVSTLLALLKTSFATLQIYLPENVHNDVLQIFRTLYPMFGCILPHMVHIYCTNLCSEEKPADYIEKCREDNNVSDNEALLKEANLQGIQVLSQYKEFDVTLIERNDSDLEQIILARSKLVGDLDKSVNIHVLEKAIDYQKSESLPGNILDISWEELILPLESLRLLTEVINKSPEVLTSEHWDSIQIAVATWLQFIHKSSENYGDIKVSALISAVSQLYCALQTLMYNHEQRPRADLPPDLLDEWKNVFADEVQSSIILIWVAYNELYNKRSTVLKPVIILDYLGKAISLLDRKVFFKGQFEEAPSAKVNLDEVITLSLTLLRSPVQSIQLGAYHTMKHMISYLVKRDKLLIESENFDTTQLNIRKLEDVLLTTQNIVNVILVDFRLCDTVSCTIQPFTDSYTYTLAYLLTWTLILEMCSKAHGDLRYQYAEILKNDYFQNFLDNIFRLMPVEILQDNRNKASQLVEFFSTTPSFNFAENWTERRLDHIVCWLYTNSLRYLPVLVRHWWSTTDSRVSTAIDRMTTLYISPMLCHEELLNNKLTNIPNLQVKVRLADREVIALYRLDETVLEISVVLPPNYPLGAVMVHQGQVAANLKNCQMQLSIFLTYQNGSICDGLELWKKNLDKKFAGVEECFICYGVFHISTYQLPKLTCRTCHNKFHSRCMYKWFNTSQKSTCPICRNVF